MKRTISGMLFFGMIMSASLWAHHMAEGIISDELWNSIDESLEGTPHDEILSLSGPDMDVQTDADTGTIFLESVVRVDFEELVRAVDYESLVQEVIDLYVLPAVDAMNRIPSVTVISTPEQIDSRMLFLTYELVDDGVFENGQIDYALITTYEPIGKGNSQDVPPDSPEDPPFGNRNGN